MKDPQQNIIHRFKYHISIIAINDKKFEHLFEFKFVKTEDITSEINKLHPTKTTTDISIVMLKDYVDIFAPILTDLFNDCVRNGTFAAELQLADISPISKSINSTDQKKHRPRSILRSASKLFEKLLQKRLSPFFDKHLSEHLCGFRKGYSTQNSLPKLTESL